MDTMLAAGDHAVDGRGIPVAVEGVREQIQRALIRLSVRRGSFVWDRDFGSELYKLPQAPAANRDRVALGYAREALSSLAGVQVESASCALTAPDALRVQVGLVIDKAAYTVEIGVA